MQKKKRDSQTELHVEADKGRSRQTDLIICIVVVVVLGRFPVSNDDTAVGRRCHLYASLGVSSMSENALNDSFISPKNGKGRRGRERGKYEGQKRKEEEK